VRTPRFITVWHEIVNEIAGGKPISVTYCPLTGSTLVFAGELADGRATTFGTSGMLDNSNLVMYDRVTKSMWPQLLGVAVRGERKGERLRGIGGAVTTTFGRWKTKFPSGVVLSRDTGHARAYGTWPLQRRPLCGQSSSFEDPRADVQNMRESLGNPRRRSSVVEQRFRKPPVGSSSLPVGSSSRVGESKR
jgi:hypothetical protein